MKTALLTVAGAAHRDRAANQGLDVGAVSANSDKVPTISCAVVGGRLVAAD